ncbi:EF-hand calcium-binding domain protein [Paraphoma chrysanthemicola]|nr:EF-hand calcium-binding domain protein [Paraphoma chrysanthemicola]
MRFLCLHGRGTNSDIFQSQLSPLISRLSPEHIFDFIDAQFEAPAAPGVADIFPGPFFVWHQNHDPQSVEKVHDYLTTVIAEDGPYDGIIGFSEGAALSASYLLSKEYQASLGDVYDYPDTEIKMAVFFNSVKLYSPSEEIGSDATKQFQQDLRQHSLFLKGRSEERKRSSVSHEHTAALAKRRQSVVSQRRESIIAWKNGSMAERRASATSTLDEGVDEKAQSQVWNSLFSPVFCFDPNSFPCKIQIPTLNVIGAKDEFQNYSVELTTLCDPEQMEVAVLDIGHDIPRAGEGLERITEAFELVTMMASIGGS